MSLTGLVCILVIGGISTSIAYWLWGRLLRDYPAAQVVPFALLVPFVGSAASSIVFGERFGPLRLAGMVTVVGGIAVMLLRGGGKRSQSRSFQGSPERKAMSQSLLLAFLVFVSVMFFTPGPNNIMLLSSGLTYGFRRTLPHMAGVMLGGAFMVGAVGLGLGAVFIAYPVLKTILKYAGAAYLIYLAAVIAMSGAARGGPGQPARPDYLLGRGDVPMDQRQGLGDGDRDHHRLRRHRRLSLEHRDPDRHQPGDGNIATASWAFFGSSLRPILTSPPRGAGLQRRDGAVAAGLALPGVHGRMMPPDAMREKGFP